jgi:thymidylate synthase (FAD)
MREWRHVFRLRTSSAAHPQMRQVMIPLHCEFSKHLPELFADL